MVEPDVFGAMRSGPPYSPKCLEEAFSEVRFQLATSSRKKGAHSLEFIRNSSARALLK
jgi:hypothetical protein